MTASTMTAEFQQAARSYQERTPRAGGFPGNLTIPLPPKTLPDLAELRQRLQVLVRFGYLSAEQADVLWSVLSSGTFVALPAIPFPGSVTGAVTLYDLLQVLVTNRLEGVDFDVAGTVETIGHIIIVIAQTAEAVGDALSDFWHWLTD